MRSNIVPRVVRAAIVAALLSASIILGQQSKDVPRAPLPAQIAGATRVFISYADGIVGDLSPDDRVYDRLYWDLKNWGRYELLTAPANADLILEVSAMSVVGPIGTLEKPLVGNYPRLRLAILDPKTHVVLWAFNEHVEVHGGAFSAYLGFDDSIAKLVDDLKNLDTRAKATAERDQK